MFDTYKSSAQLDAFIASGIEEDFIVIAACKDDCVTNLSEAGKQWFAGLGSTEIAKLKYRHSFAFIGKKNGGDTVERRGMQQELEVQLTQVL